MEKTHIEIETNMIMGKELYMQQYDNLPPWLLPSVSRRA